MEFNHISVLLKECIEGLNIDPEGIYVDGTLGGAGHGYEVCRCLSERGRFIGIDQDEDAIMASAERLSEFGDKVTIIKSNYVHMKQILAEQGIDKVNGILLDLGVSSYQLDPGEARRVLVCIMEWRIGHGGSIKFRDVKRKIFVFFKLTNNFTTPLQRTKRIFAGLKVRVVIVSVAFWKMNGIVVSGNKIQRNLIFSAVS